VGLNVQVLGLNVQNKNNTMNVFNARGPQLKFTTIKKGKKQRTVKKGKTRIFTLQAKRRAHNSSPYILPIPTLSFLSFYFCLKESLSQKENKARKK
jgi:hypothetical protein